MKHPALEALQTHKLIADIKRVIAIINDDIAAEPELIRVSDSRFAKYSLLRESLAARKDNLEATLASLEKRVQEVA
jgi:hypothetical protein